MLERSFLFRKIASSFLKSSLIEKGTVAASSVAKAMEDLHFAH